MDYVLKGEEEPIGGRGSRYEGPRVRENSGPWEGVMCGAGREAGRAESLLRARHAQGLPLAHPLAGVQGDHVL